MKKYKLKKFFELLHKKFGGNCESDKMINSGNTGKTSKAKTKTMSPVRQVVNLMHRFFLLILRKVLTYAYGGKGKQMPRIDDLTLLESATSLAYKIRTKKLTSTEVTKSFITRIQQINPLLNCVVDNRFDEALKDAAEADQLIASGTYTEEALAKKKPFLGVPITTKDCIMVEGMLHTAGLHKRRNLRSSRDAKVIALMREAGAIPLALTNVSECCMWWESSNTIYGRTSNPYDTNRIVGGSSGGEGCLQAAAGSPFGIGSDIGGSIRMPAFFNGVFGHKPSKCIVSNDGQYPAPICEEQSSFLGIGPMSRYTIDLKPVLKIIAAENAELLNLDEPVSLEKLNFFYQEDDGGGFLVSEVDQDIRKSLRKVVKYFETVLKVKPQKVQLDKFRKSSAIWFANMKDDTGIGFDAQLANLEGKINPYWELFKWFFGMSNHTFIALLTAIIESNGVKYGSEKYHYLVTQRNDLLKEIDEMLGSNGVFLYPTHPTVAPYHREPVIRTLNFSYTGIINVLGLPATAIPLGIGSEGLPLGIQVVANINQDRLCLAVAAELERAFGGWVAPDIAA